MKQDEILEWLKSQVGLDEAFKIVSGVDPCKGLRPGTYKFNTHSIFGEGEDKRPSMSIDLQKGVFYCHRTGFGGDVFNLIAGKITEEITSHEWSRMIDTLTNYVLNRKSHRKQNAIKSIKISETAPKQSTAHLISKGMPKAWKYFKASMKYGYGANPKIKRALELWLKSYRMANDIDMGPIHDYTATLLGWCDISNALVIPYGLDKVEMMELIFFIDGRKNIGAYPFSSHRKHPAFQKMHAVNGDHSFFSGATERPKVDLKPWPAGIGLETPPATENIYGTGVAGHEIVICEGVKDAIMARYHGFYSVAHHGGSSQLRKIANVQNLFVDENGTERPTYSYVCMDSDPIGEKGAIMCRGAFRGRKNLPYIVDVGQQATRGDGYDLHDFFTDGGTAETLSDYFKEARNADVHWWLR